MDACKLLGRIIIIASFLVITLLFHGSGNCHYSVPCYFMCLTEPYTEWLF